MTTQERAVKLINEHLGVEVEKITPEARFVDDLGADSLDVIELVMAFEEEFGTEIPDEAAENFDKVQDVLDFLAKNNVA